MQHGAHPVRPEDGEKIVDESRSFHIGIMEPIGVRDRGGRQESGKERENGRELRRRRDEELLFDGRRRSGRIIRRGSIGR